MSTVTLTPVSTVNGTAVPAGAYVALSDFHVGGQRITTGDPIAIPKDTFVDSDGDVYLDSVGYGGYVCADNIAPAPALTPSRTATVTLTPVEPLEAVAEIRYFVDGVDVTDRVSSVAGEPAAEPQGSASYPGREHITGNSVHADDSRALAQELLELANAVDPRPPAAEPATFEEGAKVRVSSRAFYREAGAQIFHDEEGHPYPVGIVGTVSEGPDGDGDYEVEVDGGPFECFAPECLELVVEEPEPTFPDLGTVLRVREAHLAVPAGTEGPVVAHYRGDEDTRGPVVRIDVSGCERPDPVLLWVEVGKCDVVEAATPAVPGGAWDAAVDRALRTFKEGDHVRVVGAPFFRMSSGSRVPHTNVDLGAVGTVTHEADSVGDVRVHIDGFGATYLNSECLIFDTPPPAPEPETPSVPAAVTMTVDVQLVVNGRPLAEVLEELAEVAGRAA